MGSRPSRKPNPGHMGSQVLVIDGAMLEETAVADFSRRGGGDIIDGLRMGLLLSAIIWAGLIILGVFIFG